VGFAPRKQTPQILLGKMRRLGHKPRGKLVAAEGDDDGGGGGGALLPYLQNRVANDDGGGGDRREKSLRRKFARNSTAAAAARLVCGLLFNGKSHYYVSPVGQKESPLPAFLMSLSPRKENLLSAATHMMCFPAQIPPAFNKGHQRRIDKRP
jgi:hypothetical protein